MKPMLLFVYFCLLGTLVAAQEQQTPREIPKAATFEIHRAASDVQIDGSLDEVAWERATVIPIAYEWQPGDNVAPPVKTDCLVTFDEDKLYIGFRAYDPEPSKIRAHLMDRDSIDTFIQDDHVGVMIDPFNDARRAIQLRINALGIQADAIFGELEGIEDFSWDIIWNTAGKINEEGYFLEISIPFNQIRFPRAARAQMWGFEAFRSYPRSVRHRMSSRFTDRNSSCILCQQNHIAGLEGMTAGYNLEFDPTFTVNRTDNRPDFPAGPLTSGDNNFEPGITARWGLTSNMTLNGTINPDFSQVEADVAQLNVNTRFALFFPEKRPFFLEGIDFFSTPLEAVFTRTVADPTWGVKLTGKEGKDGIGVFATRDEINNLVFPSNQSSDFAQVEQEVNGAVLRYRRDVGSRSILGVLYAGREASGYHNRVAGTDGFLRFSNSDTARYQVLRSDTEYPIDLVLDRNVPSGNFAGNALRVQYNHFGRDWIWNAGYDDIDPEFRADSGFIPRVDLRTANGGIIRRFFGDGKSWYTQIQLGANFTRTENHDGLLTDRNFELFGNFGGPLQSFLEASVSRKKEFFDRVTYDLTTASTTFQIKPNGDLSFQFFAEIGDGIDFSNSRPGDITTLAPSIEWKIGQSLNMKFDHTLQRIDINQGRVLSANLSQLKIVYQFSTRMFARAILQYLSVKRDEDLYSFPVEPESRSLFTQFLLSYKLNPQTVIFAGYSDNRLGFQNIDMIQTDRTFFLKVGYAWLF